MVLQSVAGYLQSDAVIDRKGIQFFCGLPKFKEVLQEIDPKFNNVLVFDNLMVQTTDSRLVSLLFAQGRHRNATGILLLQNMFPKGKFKMDFSRNAQYMALFPKS